MRTTVTLDDDVAAELERLRRDGNRTFKDVVNDTLRAGLRPAPAHPVERVQYTQPRPLGARVDVSDASAVLAMLDDEKYAYLADSGRS
jgi:Arc/MetJ family transcription regulator